MPEEIREAYSSKAYNTTFPKKIHFKSSSFVTAFKVTGTLFFKILNSSKTYI